MDIFHFPVESLVEIDGITFVATICGCDPRFEYPMGHEDMEDKTFIELTSKWSVENLPPF